MTIYHDTQGWLYILCLGQPLGNPENPRAMASHYLGWTVDLPRRLATHAAGNGGSLTAAAVARGITWTVYYRPGTPELERFLKARYKQTPMLCPTCAGRRGRRPAYGFQPLGQLAIDITAEPLPDLPEPPQLRPDWHEIQTLRRWSQARAGAGAGMMTGLDDQTVDIPY